MATHTQTHTHANHAFWKLEFFFFAFYPETPAAPPSPDHPPPVFFLSFSDDPLLSLIYTLNLSGSDGWRLPSTPHSNTSTLPASLTLPINRSIHHDKEGPQRQITHKPTHNVSFFHTHSRSLSLTHTHIHAALLLGASS